MYCHFSGWHLFMLNKLHRHGLAEDNTNILFHELVSSRYG